jgi:hypothetical protein
MKYKKKKNISIRYTSPKTRSSNSIPPTEEVKCNTITTQDINEIKELEECTFQPKVNKSKIRQDNIHDKLYNDSKIYSGKRHENTIKQFVKESQDLTFSPRLNRVRSSSKDSQLKRLEDVKLVNIA